MAAKKSLYGYEKKSFKYMLMLLAAILLIDHFIFEKLMPVFFSMESMPLLFRLAQKMVCTLLKRYRYRTVTEKLFIAIASHRPSDALA